ncbi:MAG: hypothetical protein LBM38_01315 [Clostridiales bacterium]|jgi:hypothetical protein|nr:hypothetical protein [Clostridiales bacterium]
MKDLNKTISPELDKKLVTFLGSLTTKDIFQFGKRVKKFLASNGVDKPTKAIKRKVSYTKAKLRNDRARALDENIAQTKTLYSGMLKGLSKSQMRLVDKFLAKTDGGKHPLRTQTRDIHGAITGIKVTHFHDLLQELAEQNTPAQKLKQTRSSVKSDAKLPAKPYKLNPSFVKY